MNDNPTKQWFIDRMGEQGLSLSEVARRMGIDKAALSRALNGSRQVKLSEVDEIATILKVTPTEVSDHIKSIPKRAIPRKGYREREGGGRGTPPSGLAGGAPQGDQAPSGAAEGERRPLYPGFGFMKGLIKIEPGFDVTGPFSDESWEDGYLGEDRLTGGDVRKAQR